MKIKLLIYLFFCSCFVSMAQSPIKITGIVKDSVSNEALIGAAISFSNGQKGVLADLNGKFEAILKSSNVSVTVKYIGYETYKFKPSTTNTSLTILLKKQDTDLEEVIIRNEATLQGTQRPILGANMLNIKTVNKLPTALGETDILKGLQMLPGVNSVGEASNGLNVRGGTTDQNLMLLDNAPIFNPTHMFGLFSAFPSDAVSNLQLYKGNIPAKYGGRVASVLDISLSNPSLTKFNASGGIGIVSQKLRLDIPLVKDKIGLMIAGRASFNDFVLPLISPKLADMKSNFGDGVAKLFFRLGQKNTLSLSTYFSHDFFQTTLLGTISNITASATQFQYQTNNYTGKWIYAINPKSTLETIVVSSQYRPDILLPEVSTSNKSKILQQIDYNQLKTNYRHIQAKNTFEFGFDVLKYRINAGELQPSPTQTAIAKTTAKENGLETGIYLSDDIDFSNKLQASVGFRYSMFMNLGPNEVRTYKADLPKNDQNIQSSKTYSANEVSKSYGGFEPRIGLKYAISKQTNLKFGYNLSRQYLQQVSNTTTPLPTSRWKLADTHILPQISQLVTAGVSKNSKDNMYQLGLELYYRGTNNVLDYKPGADFFLKDFPETEILQGFNKSYGVELMASKEKGTMTGWVNYTYSRSLNQVNEGNAPEQQINFGNFYRANYDRPHTLNASMIIGQGKHHDFSFNFTYSTGRPFTTPQGYVQYNGNKFPYYSERNNERIPAYHRLDFAWNIYNPKMNPNKRFKGNWAFSVYNIYGRANPYSIFYRSENRVQNPYKLIIFGSPIPSLSYKFTFE